MPPDPTRPAFEFASDEDLLDRLSARPHELVYLVGSAVTAPSRAGEPGVPRVDGVIELIRGDAFVFQVAEAGVDAVDCLAAGKDAIDPVTPAPGALDTRG